MGNCGLAVDSERCAYLTGTTVSSDFPTENAYQSSNGFSDAFLTKFSSTGSSLVYSTYLGGAGIEQGWALSVGTDLRVYLTGSTTSLDFPTREPYQAGFQGPDGYTDVFVSLFSSSGTTLVYSTYLGGSNGGFERGYGIVAGSDGSAYITGYTEASNFPIFNPYQSTTGGG